MLFLNKSKLRKIYISIHETCRSEILKHDLEFFISNKKKECCNQIYIEECVLECDVRFMFRKRKTDSSQKCTYEKQLFIFYDINIPKFFNKYAQRM